MHGPRFGVLPRQRKAIERPTELARDHNDARPPRFSDTRVLENSVNPDKRFLLMRARTSVRPDKARYAIPWPIFPELLASMANLPVGLQAFEKLVGQVKVNVPPIANFHPAFVYLFF